MPWHPAVVHFPIVLLLLAVSIDVLAVLGGRPDWHRTTWRLLLFGTLSALVAVITGNASAADYREAGKIAEKIQDHEDAATVCLLLFVVICLGRLPLALGRDHTRRWLPYWIALSVAAAAGLILASDLGGQLVFHHGVGVHVTGVP
ncbi:MAG: DUF2231 domain-containing protein [Gemmatimonadetes bacterium]|jgi:uncharacterized membrane protein|nr:DUF2231 domain-containing protein [Gemmatimonadota bacterium]MBT6145337.1 DUF2231 domain-containing protein [Gemmatimonadota bacterium]MBT7859906.1 DUF2231 domain-containing protein [Gemmatimonadota bacterium]